MQVPGVLTKKGEIGTQIQTSTWGERWQGQRGGHASPNQGQPRSQAAPKGNERDLGQKPHQGPPRNSPADTGAGG